MQSRISPALAIGLIAGGAAFLAAGMVAAQQQPQQPYTPPTEAIPAIGPADASLRVVALPNGKRIHVLPATLETTQWGWYDNAQPPVLRINAGDTVVLETMMHSHNQIVPGTTIEQIKRLRTDYPGRGPHTITGPIYVKGAEPGDVLKVRLDKIVPRAYGSNFNVPGMFGEFPKNYPDGQVKYFYLDWDRKIAEFLPVVEIPLRPFPGTIGVARKEPGRYSTVPPGEYGGNMDIRDLVEGTTLYLPVFVPGALLWSGDSHAAQGNGEVNLTALETAYKELRLTIDVLEGTPLAMPRIETPTSWISIGLDSDLNKAWEQAKAETIKLLAEQRKISPEQAMALMAELSDCRVSQVVDIKKGIHCLSPKTQSHAEDTQRPTGETANYFVSYMKDADLNKAMDGASMGMIKWLENEKKIARLDAYGLASVAMDCRVGTVTDTEKAIHCLMPKSIFVGH